MSIVADGGREGLAQWQLEVAEQVTAHLPWLMGAARKIAPPGIEAEDLLSEAVTKVLTVVPDEKTSRISNIRSYIASIMRNSAIDFSRAPASRVDAQEDSFFVELEEELHEETVSLRATDLHQEFEIVRQAFSELDPADQALLDQVLLAGNRTAEAGKALGYSAATTSTRLFRAKLALKRLVLLQHLRKGGSKCADNAAKISGEVHTDPDEHSQTARGMRHVRECEECQRNWRRFGQMSQALGITTLLTVGLSSQKLGAGLAVGGSALGGSAPDASAQASSTPTSSVQGSSALGGSALGGSPAGGAPVALITPKGPWRQALSSTASFVAACVLLAAAAGSFTTHFVLGDRLAAPPFGETRTLTSGEQLDAHFTARASESDGIVDVAIDFNITDADSWTLTSLSLALPPGAAIELSPTDLDCLAAGQFVRCTTGTENWSGGTFQVRLSDDSAATGSRGTEFKTQISVTSVRDIELTGEAVAAL